MPHRIHKHLNKFKRHTGIHTPTEFVPEKKINHPKKLKSFLFNMYAFKLFSGCVFLYPVMSIMFLKNGVSNIEISILFALWAFFVFIFQPFVGNIGDKFSRKKLLLIGQFAKMFCFAIFIMFPNFAGYLIGFVFWGLQWAIEASICEAFVYDELLCLDAKEKYTEVSGRMLAFQQIGFFISTLGSFIAAEWGYNFVMFITIVNMLLSAVFIHRIKMIQPTSFVKKKKDSLLKHIEIGAKTIVKIKYLILTMFILSCVMSVAELDDYLGLLGTEIGVPMEFIGIMFAIANISEMIGGFAAKHFAKFSARSISSIIVIMGLIFGLASLSNIYIIWPILFASYFIYAIIRISLTTKIQNAVPSNRRSMVLSLYDMLGQASIMIFYGLITIGSTLSGYRLGYLLCGSAIIFLGIIGMIFIHDIKPMKNQPCCSIEN
ncbi:MAG TPA: MFS transporter [Alphaproteobacteria bacterium]|nr:MFS transporter [Alphaproteobacteria bacterium]